MRALQGPVLSGNKKLVAEKLAEEEAERKVKSEAKKEKHLVIQNKNIFFVGSRFCLKLEICMYFGYKCLYVYVYCSFSLNWILILIMLFNVVGGRKGACETSEKFFRFTRKVSYRSCYKRRYWVL